MVNEHESEAAGIIARCAVLTISDTRNAATDKGGPKLREGLESFGHTIVESRIVKDDPGAIRAALREWIDRSAVDAIIATGGTGIGQRDNTVAVVHDMLALELEGFGELFRMLSWDQVGPAAMLSRAIGGLAVPPDGSPLSTQGIFIFALPGSVRAVELAVTRLIGPVLGHLLRERRK
jgi:molybdenum cofactor biosynthesis protein B